MDKTLHLAVENKKEDATGQQEHNHCMEMERRSMSATWFRRFSPPGHPSSLSRPRSSQVTACWMWLVAPESTHASRLGRSVPPGRSSGWTSMQGCERLPARSHQFQASRWSGRRAVHLSCPLRMRPLTSCCVSKVCSFSRIARLHSVRCTGCWCLGGEWS